MYEPINLMISTERESDWKKMIALVWRLDSEQNIIKKLRPESGGWRHYRAQVNILKFFIKTYSFNNDPRSASANIVSGLFFEWESLTDG